MAGWNEADFASVLLIRHSDGKAFGTGFAVWHDEEATWFVTCAHVVDTRPEAKLFVGDLPAEVVANGRPEGRAKKVDLAVLKVRDLLDIECLPLVPSQDPALVCRIPGWSEHAGLHRGLCLEARLGQPFPLTEEGGLIARGWPVEIQGEGRLQKGYSGAPVIRAVQGTVFAVAAINEDEGKAGTAICISHLQDIWPDMPADLLGAVTDVDLGGDLQRSLTHVFEQLPDGVSLSDLRAVCTSSAPQGLPLDWPEKDDPAQFLTWLLNRPKLTNNRLLLYDVLDFLAPKAKGNDLLHRRIDDAVRQIDAYYAEHSHLDTTPLRARPPPPPDTLARVEVIFRPRSIPQDKGFAVESRWHLPGVDTPKTGPDRRRDSGGQLDMDDEKAIERFAAELMEMLGTLPVDREQVRFEFVLPDELLLHPVEQWPQDPLFRVPLGRDFQVVVRSSERRSNTRYWSHWKSVWERLKPYLQHQVSKRLWCPGPGSEALDNATVAGVLREVEQGRCVALARVPDLSVRTNLLFLVILRGAPVVLWPRVPEAEPDFCDALKEAFGDQPLDDMPRRLRKMRAECLGQAHASPWRQHLTLLWDDPTCSTTEQNFKIGAVSTSATRQDET